MRIMPFMKRKKGVQFAGIGFDGDSGGGGGGTHFPDIGSTPVKIATHGNNSIMIRTYELSNTFLTNSNVIIDEQFTGVLVNVFGRYAYTSGDISMLCTIASEIDFVKNSSGLVLRSRKNIGNENDRINITIFVVYEESEV